MNHRFRISAGLPVLGCLALLGCFAANDLGDTVRGSGVVRQEPRSVAPFTQVRVSGSVDVEFTRSPETSAVVEADDNIVPLVDTVSHGDVLEIKAHQAYSSSDPVRVLLKGPRLGRLEISGSGSAILRQLDGKQVDIDVSGSGGVRADGSIASVHAEISGSGSISAAELKASDVTASISGSGNMELYASQSLDASISGSGNIHCSGSPGAVQQHISGSGHVSVN